MRYNKLILLSLVIVLCSIFYYLNSDTIAFNSKEDISIKELSTEIPLPLEKPINLISKVEEGKQLLELSPPLLFEERNTGRYSTALVRKQIALAIFDRDNDTVFERRVWVRENEIKSYHKTGHIDLTPDIGGEGINISVKWWNSFNTLYEVNNGPNFAIVANKYLLETSFIPNPAERSKSKYTDIIYSPYSEQLHTAEVIVSGKDYIDNKVDAAYNSLALRNVQSVSMPGKLVTDVINKDFIKNIIVVEHIDPGAFFLSGDGGRFLTERVLTIIGLNKDRAYGYTGSPAGASGLAQFIRSTYDSTKRNYPSAGLINDFSLGMADHENAFKSMVLFFDSHKKAIEDNITRKDILGQLGGVTEEMLALAYNGGPGRVIQSVNKYGPTWIVSQLESSRPRIFRSETLGYFNKFASIKSLNIF